MIILSNQDKIMEQTIATIIAQFGPELWLAAVTLIVTTFVMMWIRGLVADFFNYYKAKAAMIGEQAVIIQNRKPYLVEEIKFKTVKLVNGDDIMFIPMKTWVNMTYTVPRYKHGIDIQAGKDN